MFNIARDIKITGTETISLKGKDVIKVVLNDKDEFKYEVPDGRLGTLAITLNGLLTD